MSGRKGRLAPDLEGDPEAGDAAFEFLWKAYEEQAKAREDYERTSMQIQPKPGFVAKTVTVEEGKADVGEERQKVIPIDTKVFINICSHNAIGQASEEPGEAGEAPRLRVPLSCGPLFADKDVHGNFALTCDVVFNPSTVQMCDGDFNFRQYVVHIAGEKIQTKYSLLLDAERVSYLKNIKYKGSNGVPPPQRIRKPQSMIEAEALAAAEAARPKSAKDAISKEVEMALQKDFEDQVFGRNSDIDLKEAKSRTSKSSSSRSTASTTSARPTTSISTGTSTSTQSRKSLIEEVPTDDPTIVGKLPVKRTLKYNLTVTPQEDPTVTLSVQDYLNQYTQAPIKSMRASQRAVLAQQEAIARSILGSSDNKGVPTPLHMQLKGSQSKPQPPPPEGPVPAPLCLNMEVKVPLSAADMKKILASGHDSGKDLAAQLPFNVQVRARSFAIQLLITAKGENNSFDYEPLILSLPQAIDASQVTTTVNVQPAGVVLDRLGEGEGGYVQISVNMPSAFPARQSPAREKAALERIRSQEASILASVRDIDGTSSTPIQTLPSLGKITSIKDLDAHIQDAFGAWHKYFAAHSSSASTTSQSGADQNPVGTDHTFTCPLIDELIL